MVKNVVTASAPAAPSEPPSILNTFTESVKESFVQDMVIGKLALDPFNPPTLNAPVNDTLPLTVPLPPLILLLSNEKFVTVLLSAVVIVISDDCIASSKFCCANENTILCGVDELSVESSNANI